jgi:hypothetical protein
MDLLARDKNALVPPGEPIIEAWVGEVLVSADYQQHDIMDAPDTEPILEGGIPLIVFDPEYPIEELAEPMLEPRRPFRGRFRRLPEDARRPCIFELDEAVLMARRVADGQVRHVIAEDIKIRCRDDIFEIDDRRIVGAHEGAELGMALEEGEDVFRFAEIGPTRIIEERSKILEVGLDLLLVDRDGTEGRHRQNRRFQPFLTADASAAFAATLAFDFFAAEACDFFAAEACDGTFFITSWTITEPSSME